MCSSDLERSKVEQKAYLIITVGVLSQFDLAHAPRTQCLAKGVGARVDLLRFFQ